MMKNIVTFVIMVFTGVALAQPLINGIQCSSNAPVAIPVEGAVSICYLAEDLLFTIDEYEQLLIYRVHGIAQLQSLGRVQIGIGFRTQGHKFRLEGDRLYVLADEKLTVVDLSDLLDPIVIPYQTDEEIASFDVRDDTVYMTLTGKHLEVVDFHDPNAPVVRWESDDQVRGQVLVRNDRLWIAGSNLTAFDISDPYAPAYLSSYHTNYLPVHAALNDHLIATARHLGQIYLYEYDESGDIEFVGMIQSHVGERLTFENNRLYAMSRDAGIYVYDTSDSRHPRLLTTMMDTAYNNSFGLRFGVVYAPADTYMPTLDVFDARSPRPVYLDDNTIAAGDVIGVDGYAYSIQRLVGLQVYDCRDPFNIKHVYSEDEYIYSPYNIVHHGQHLFAATGGGIRCYDMTDPEHPELISVAETYVTTIEYHPPLLYAMKSYQYDNVFSILDYSDPKNPIELDSLELNVYGLGDFEMLGNTVYATTSEEGVYRIDVTDPSNIQLLGSSMAGHRILNPIVQHEGRLVVMREIYSPDLLFGISVLAPSEDGDLQEVAFADRYAIYAGYPEPTRDSMHLDRDTLYFGGQSLYVFDISDTDDIQYVNHWTPPGSSYNHTITRLVTDGDVLYASRTSQPAILFNIGLCSDCPADYDNNSKSTALDIGLFLDAYTHLDPSADLTGDGQLNFFDVSSFIFAFQRPCEPD